MIFLFSFMFFNTLSSFSFLSCFLCSISLFFCFCYKCFNFYSVVPVFCIVFLSFELRKKSHSVSLFTGQECPKISMTSNPRQNCRIGQLTTKKCFFSPDQFGLRRKRKGKSGEIRSLLETLGSTL